MASLNWSYEGDNGPDQWHKLYPVANGNLQSPIDIKTKNVKKDPSLGHLHVTWNLSTCKEIVNIGHSFHVNFEDKDNRSVVTGGPLTGNYRLQQFHFHWGRTDDYGSEHTVDGRKYASELHLVHWNSDKYSSFAEASDKPDGLAIIAVFLQVGPPHECVQKIVTALGSIKTKGKKAPFTNFDPSTLLPGSLDYWTYPGSLTHPPLLESVTWIIYKEPITVSSEQLAQFRSLTVTNHRLPQPLKGRQVRT
ncbi:carbonic anhydrase 1 [Pelodiscus sinensis]|uniref:carbonic anhydrase 1 n=1 Tax=Pelodiscus sinensis TaxID=13735 RepID=UPI0003C45E47|nr:carbonic anhydrase 1 [Pelodiscus sinensis]|eukprot:XP_006113045.1 carbonic anhydrase 1 [Pelodiscus sinensis]